MNVCKNDLLKEEVYVCMCVCVCDFFLLTILNQVGLDKLADILMDYINIKQICSSVFVCMSSFYIITDYVSLWEMMGQLRVYHITMYRIYSEKRSFFLNFKVSSLYLSLLLCAV